MTPTTEAKRLDAPGSDATAKQAEPVMKSKPIRRASRSAALAARTAAEAALIWIDPGSSPGGEAYEPPPTGPASCHGARKPAIASSDGDRGPALRLKGLRAPTALRRGSRGSRPARPIRRGGLPGPDGGPDPGDRPGSVGPSNR